jgi:hypothetical protein
MCDVLRINKTLQRVHKYTFVWYQNLYYIATLKSSSKKWYFSVKMKFPSGDEMIVPLKGVLIK